MNVVQPLRRRDDCIVLVRGEGAWLVVGPRSNGWAFGNLSEARDAARWLARNMDWPIKERFNDFST